MSEHIKITPIHLIAEDERGSTYDFTVKPGGKGDFVCITRKKGSMSGNTYHEGLNEGTNLKTFVFLSGEVEFGYRHIEEDEHHIAKITEPSIVEINPNVTHYVKAVTDILLIECNSLNDILEDRKRVNVIKDEVTA